MGQKEEGAEAEEAALRMNQKSCRNKAKQAHKPEEEEQQKLAKAAPAKFLDKEGAAVAIQSAWKSSRQEGAVEAKKDHADTVLEKSAEANSSVPQTVTHAGGKKEAIPKVKAEKTTKKKREGKDVAVQRAKAEDGAERMNQKSCRNKAKQAQKLEEEEQQKLATEAPAKPLDKEDAAEAIQSAQKYIHREGAVEAKKDHADTVLEKSAEANSSVPQTFTHAGGKKEAIPQVKAGKTT